MRKKGFMVLGLTVAMSLSLPLLSYAGEWKEDNIGKWYQNDDGTYPVDTWKWIDGNKDGVAECYYFNENGYCLMATTTPDGYTVNESGAMLSSVTNTVEIRHVKQDGSINTLEEEAQYVREWYDQAMLDYYNSRGGYEVETIWLGGKQYDVLLPKEKEETNDFHPSQELLDMIDEATDGAMRPGF